MGPARPTWPSVVRTGRSRTYDPVLRLAGTRWEPLLWAAPWLWHISGNPFLDREYDDYPEPEDWSLSNVLRLSAKYREALRVMRAVDAFDSWLLQAPAERIRAAVEAAPGPPSGRIPTLPDLPVIQHQAESRCSRAALVS